MTVEDVKREDKSRDPRKFVTVCDNCLRASCWQGEFMCQNSKYSGTVDLPVSTLLALNLESPDYFNIQKGHIENNESKSTHQEDMSKESTDEPAKGFEEALRRGGRGMNQAELTDIRERCEKATPGPWGWFGYPNSSFYLATQHSGRRYVMGFERMGMRGAQPTFQVKGEMKKGVDLCRFEVARNVVGIEAAKKQGSGVYRKDIVGFDHPDAEFISHARTDIPALLDHIREQEEEIERLKKLIPPRGSWDNKPIR